MQRCAVLGAGTMGHGIAQIAAQSGFEVVLYDVTRDAAEKGLARIRANLDTGVAKGKVTAEAREAALAKLRAVDSLAALEGAQWVVEAVPEDLALKQRLLGELAKSLGPDALLASNTSSLSLTKLAAGLPHPERVIGMHFFNPPHLMKLLELVRAEQSSPETVALARALGEKLGKTCIEVRDSPGFASSRLGICLAMEAIRMVEAQVASPADIDAAMELGYNHPMGPLKLTDHVGLDVRLTIADHLRESLGSDVFRAPELLRRMVAEGKLGKKSGEGFYRYDTSLKTK
ncbi:MAG: 3-hydroxyacyl-CoA dehydrogenase family protein [Deltaproteobacteria bacterium]|nr:3-hydroxyacyl-CoA dehydrogenase family protein [Deltaproteobacteria bacterium]